MHMKMIFVLLAAGGLLALAGCGAGSATSTADGPIETSAESFTPESMKEVCEEYDHLVVLRMAVNNLESGSTTAVNGGDVFPFIPLDFEVESHEIICNLEIKWGRDYFDLQRNPKTSNGFFCVDTETEYWFWAGVGNPASECISFLRGSQAGL